MEPHDLDGTIRNRIRETEITAPAGSNEDRERIWNAIDTQLRPRQVFSWYKLTALILILLLPSFYLYHNKLRQLDQIRILRDKIALIDSVNRQKTPVPQSEEENNGTAFQDAGEPARVAVPVIKTDTVEVVRYVTDTVIIYRQADFTALATDDMTQTNVSVQVQASTAETEEAPKTEYILTGIPKDNRQKPKSGRSFFIRLTVGDPPGRQEQTAGIKTRL
jgi:hypothetical protein